jgi:hypothetical protein
MMSQYKILPGQLKYLLLALPAELPGRHCDGGIDDKQVNISSGMVQSDQGDPN